MVRIDGPISYYLLQIVIIGRGCTKQTQQLTKGEIVLGVARYSNGLARTVIRGRVLLSLTVSKALLEADDMRERCLLESSEYVRN